MALNLPVVYSTDRSKAVLVLFLLFVALCNRSFVVPALLSVVFFFYMCNDANIVVTVFSSCPLCFLFY